MRGLIKLRKKRSFSAYRRLFELVVRAGGYAERACRDNRLGEFTREVC